MKLSIVTVTYKDVAGLKATLESIANQTRSVELVVIDGGTPDSDLIAVLDSPLVSKSITEPDGGIYDAMQKGLNFVTGEFVLFLNSGDILADENSLDVVISCIGAEDVHYFGSDFLSGSKHVYTRMPRNPEMSIFHSVPGNQQSTIYRVSKLKELGLSVKYSVCGDYALACKFFIGRTKSKATKKVVSKFYLGGKSTHAIVALCREAWQIQRDILKLPFVFRFLSLIVRFTALSRTYCLYRKFLVNRSSSL